MTTIRQARPDDGDALRELELISGARFRDVGLDAIAEHEPHSAATFAVFARGGRSWVAVDDTGARVGFVIADVVDGCAHVEQVSVHPDRQGTGIGRALLDQVADWAKSSGRRGITLTTFRDVPWNRPLYEHLGFRVLADDEVGAELRTVCDVETAAGLDPGSRVCMRLDLD